MGRDTYVCAIDYVAKRIGENLELLEEIAGNPDNIDYGEMIDVVTGPDKAIIAFTSRGIKNLQEFIADVRTSQGGAVRPMRTSLCKDSEAVPYAAPN